MATTATRVTTITFSGDVSGAQRLTAGVNTVSPGEIELRTLAAGANTITVPTGGATTTAVTIVPPAGNLITLTLKGVSGDTGIPIHLTDPTSIALATGSTSFVITASDIVTGLRLIWS